MPMPLTTLPATGRTRAGARPNPAVRTVGSATLTLATIALAFTAVGAIATRQARAQSTAGSASTTQGEAGEASPWSELSLTTPEAEPETLAMPWLSAEELRNNPNASWFWNAHYRGGRGTLSFQSQFHYYDVTDLPGDTPITGTNNRVKGAQFEDLFFGLTAAGVVYPGLTIGGEFGTTFTEITYPDGDNGRYDLGLYFGVMISGAIPLGNVFTLGFDVKYRHWEAQNDEPTDPPGLTRKVNLVGDYVYYELRVYIELAGEPDEFGFDFYAGFGGQLYRGKLEETDWRLVATDMGDFNVLAGLIFLIGDRVTIRVDGRYPFDIEDIDVRLSIEFRLY